MVVGLPGNKSSYSNRLTLVFQSLRMMYDYKLNLVVRTPRACPWESSDNPTRDNAKDRGEVRSLAFMAVKQFLYFAANDALPVRLIKDAAKLMTGLDDMQIVQMYELIYYLYKTGRYDNKALRILYKYQYYLTAGDKRINPEWGCFIEQMDFLYNGIL